MPITNHFNNSVTDYNDSITKTIESISHISIHLKPSDALNKNIFSEAINKEIVTPHRYSVLIRVNFLDVHNYIQWKSLGSQLGLPINSNTGVYDIDFLHDVLIRRLRDSQDVYKYNDDDINTFQILIFRVVYTNIVTEKNLLDLKSLKDSKDLVNVSSSLFGFNKTIPLVYNSDEYGKKLLPYIEKNLIIGFVSIEGYNINFIDLINKYINQDNKRLHSFGPNTKFYLKESKNDKELYIVIVEDFMLSKKIDVYNIKGVKISSMIDNKLNEDKFTRQIGNIVASIDKTGVYKKEIILKLDPIKEKNNKLDTSRVPDWKVGTIDLETYKVNNHTSKIYAMGFYVKDKLNTYYIGKDLDSEKVLVSCLNELLTDKYNNYTFYIHNMGRFDGIFILPIIIKLSLMYPHIWDYKVEFKDNRIIYLKISKIIGNKKKKVSINIYDSILMLNASLDDLCKTFTTDVRKSYFPYKFVSDKTLFHEGTKPDLNFWLSNISNDNKNEIISFFKDLPVKDWNTKEFTLKYLEQDLISLYQVIDKFKYEVFINYHTQITKCLTISGLAMKIFLNKYYNNNIPLVNKKSLYKDIKQSYYGGITEVYKPYGKDLYFYDVNSLYSYAALQPMPGLNCVYLDAINKDISECTDFFGFYDCEIIVPERYIGLIPVRSTEGIIMPTGSIKGWYFSEELLYAYKNGCKIKILSGYKFDKVYNVFTDYIEHFYKIKSTTKSPVEKMIAKSLLNNLLGRFGLNIDKNITRLVTYDEYIEILQTKKISNIIFVEGKVLVTYNREVSQEICAQHNVDYQQTLFNDIKFNKNSSTSERQFNAVSIPIASAVTSYARIFMNQVKLDVLNKGGFIYYTDTDSLVTNVELDKSLVGNEIGKFKFVSYIKEGYFVSNKTYGFIDKDNKVTLVIKGLNDKNLSLNVDTINDKSKLFNYNDIIKLYKGESVETIRKSSIKNYSLGSVTIKDDDNIIIQDSYDKRIRIYDKNNLWVDTRPIHRSYHTHVRPVKNYKNLVFNLLSFVLSIVLTYYIYNYLLHDSCDYIPIEILETILDDYEYIDFFKYEKTKIDISSYKEMYYTPNRVAPVDFYPKENYIEKSEILTKVLNSHRKENLSELLETQKELDIYKYKYNNVITDYEKVIKTLMSDLYEVKNILNNATKKS